MTVDIEFPGGKWDFVPRAEIEQRTARFQASLKRVGIELAVILQNTDLFYLTGTIQQGQLLVPAEGEPVFLVRKDPDRAQVESSVKDIRPIASLRDLPPVIAEFGLAEGAVVGMELDVVPVNIFRRYEGLMPGLVIKDCSQIIRTVRSVKSDYERAFTAEAARIVDRGYRAAVAALRPGITELELSAVCEAAMREVGNSNVKMRQFNEDWPFGNVSAGAHAGLAGYSGNPLSGAGVSPAVGAGSGWHRIAPGEPVVVDLVAFAGGYLCDQTRVISIGPLAPDLAEGQRLCREVQEVFGASARAGALCGDVYNEADDWMKAALASAGLEAYFMGAPNNQAPYIGHGVGLELDELPVLARGFKMVLEEDQVIACEPKLVFPGRGVVGVENTWRVTAGGLERITVSPDGPVAV